MKRVALDTMPYRVVGVCGRACKGKLLSENLLTVHTREDNLVKECCQEKRTRLYGASHTHISYRKLHPN